MDHKDILDREHLARYTLGDPALEREILYLFIGQLPATLASLQDCGCRGDWVQVTHTIKGSARAVGAWRLAEAAERAERAAEQVADWTRLRAEVASAATEVRRQIVEGIG